MNRYDTVSYHNGMRITLLGKGNVGTALGEAWTRAGHDVKSGGRNNLAEAVSGAEVVVNALPWPAVEGALRGLDLKDKILIDCTNPLLEDLSGLAVGTTTSGGELVAQWAPGARVVKAFNTTGSNNMADPAYPGSAIPMFYCGDDAGAKQVAAKLVADVGFTPVDAGPLSNARLLEPHALLWIWLAFHGFGREFAFELTRR